MQATLSLQNLKGKTKSLGSLLFQHAVRQWLAWCFAAVAVFLFSQNYIVGWNMSPSLPYHAFIVHKGERFGKGDLAAFRWHGGTGEYHGKTPYRQGMLFVKRVAGTPGDYINIENREVSINLNPVGRAKEFSQQGKPLEVLHLPANKQIPEGYYYMQADHKDSLDSRYEMTGLIRDDAFVGKAYVLF